MTSEERARLINAALKKGWNVGQLRSGPAIKDWRVPPLKK